MSNTFFQFKQFTIHQDKCAMKVTTDGCLFGAWLTEQVQSEKNEIKNILDIGTGTGLLSMMLAQRVSAEIDAIEIDEPAAQQAAKNVLSSPFANRIHIHCADLLQFHFTKKYDIIISNPPFYEKELKSEKGKKNLAHHNEGLLLKDLFKFIQNHLQPGGTFYLFLPYKRHEEIKTMLLQHEIAIQKMTFVRQTINHDYFRIMIAGKINAENSAEIIIDEIAIKDDQGTYTIPFKELLIDYYLFL